MSEKYVCSYCKQQVDINNIAVIDLEDFKHIRCLLSYDIEQDSNEARDL